MPIADPIAVRDRFERRGIAFLERFVALRALSPVFDPEWQAHGALERAMGLAEEAFGAAGIPGLRTHRSHLPGRSPALLVTVEGAGSGRALLYGHLDIQPATAPWRGGTSPFELVRMGDRLVGRGVVDDGYAVPAIVEALSALVAAGVALPHVDILLETGEESGSPDLEAHLNALAGEIGRPDLVVCLDSGGLDHRRLWLTASLRGNLVVAVDIAVLAHGVHSGEAGGVVPETFRILRALMERIEDPVHGEIRLGALAMEPPDEACAAAAALVEAIGDPFVGAYPLLDGVRLEGADAVERLLRQSWGTAVALTGIDGVPSVQEGGNVLRPRLRAKVSVRIPPALDARAALEALVATLQSDPPFGAQVHVQAEAPAQGWVAAPLPAWLTEALERASLAAFGEPPLSVGDGGSIPFLAALGQRFGDVPIVATGALSVASNAHGPDETLEIPAAVGVSCALAEVLAALAGA